SAGFALEGREGRRQRFLLGVVVARTGCEPRVELGDGHLAGLVEVVLEREAGAGELLLLGLLERWGAGSLGGDGHARRIPLGRWRGGRGGGRIGGRRAAAERREDDEERNTHRHSATTSGRRRRRDSSAAAAGKNQSPS